MSTVKKAVTTLACIGWVLSTMAVGAGLQSKTNQPAQPHPDFSGKWILDLGKSKLGKDQTPAKITSVTLLISQQEPVLSFTETTDYQGDEVTLQGAWYTDGRDGINRRYNDKQVEIARSIATIAYKSNTQWKGRALVTTSTTETMLPSYEMGVPVLRFERTTTSKIKRELSADGKTFTITIRGQGPKIVKVFRRAP